MDDFLANQQQIAQAIEHVFTNFKKDSSERKTSDCIQRRLDMLDKYWLEFKNNHARLSEFGIESSRKKVLYEELGCVMWGHRVVVPSSCREKVLAELHEAHMGITKTKQFAHSYVWWPGIDEAVEAVCRACSVCARVAGTPERHEPRPWLWPERPWSRLHLDFLGPIGGATYLVTVDAHSK
ncbi:unnamed protein product [Parnassius mnemosyne]|uniref:RNA-directed DNA polymerase n=1 Tax=Parnassius mnemosyne TaxID=213953 RepID=A0AAV1L211_9NEOP